MGGNQLRTIVDNLQILKRRVRHALSSHKESASANSLYGIKAGYRHRLDNAHFDDTPNKDEWQREVYERAAEIAREIGANTIVDVGCGSGFKLVKHFSQYETIGFELPPALDFVRQQYPDRTWLEASFSAQVDRADLVICADVIEHIPDPDELMAFLVRIPAKVWVISTPERRLSHGWDHSGPPRNIAHCREWTTDELTDYLSKWLSIESAVITNRRQATQMVICKPLQPRSS
jgi:SAM-dependent methyltransferase